MTSRADQDVVAPEIRAERAFMSRCRAELIRMRDEVSTMLATGAAEGDAVLDKYSNHMLREHRKKVIKELTGFDDLPLFFARLDYPAGEVFDRSRPPRAISVHTHDEDRDLVYIGRRGVRDEDGETVVIDWRAPLSRAFYEADGQDPMGVRTRRRYGFDRGGRLSAYEDEPLEDGSGSEGGERMLAAEIERPREGPMRDIVATIQPEQMRLVRAPLDETLCIQGAPGTGKTAVGLHRLAYLLFSAREQLRKRGGVAVIGPNRSFLAYIRDVLPALGEVEVEQTTIDDLTGRGIEVRRVEEPAAARIKGSAVMAEVVKRHMWSRIRPPEQELVVVLRERTWRVPFDRLVAELDRVLARGTGYGTGHELLAMRLAHLVRRQIELRGGSTPSLTTLRRSAAITRAVEQMWPAVDPARLVVGLLTDPAHLAAAAEGLLSAEEQQAILLPHVRGPATMAWSTLDLALLDEAAAQVESPPRFGHVVVDEAQDLSAMHFRAIARRVSGACTVLGDLAQATSPWAVSDWSDVLAHLGSPDGQVEALYRGYRVPSEIIDYASRILPFVARGLTVPLSFRRSAGSLQVTGTDPAELVRLVIDSCELALGREGSSALIAADDDVARLSRALTSRGVVHAVLGTDRQEGTRLTIVPVTLAKGLEYDSVIVVEPARIVAAESRGLQRLYVSLTRAVSSLHVVHGEPLPAPLQEGPPQELRCGS